MFVRTGLTVVMCARTQLEMADVCQSFAEGNWRVPELA